MGNRNFDPGELSACLKSMGDDFVFIIGNGINRYLSDVPSWNELLQNVATAANIELSPEIAKVMAQKESDAGLNFPEMYSLIDTDFTAQKRVGEKNGGVKNKDTLKQHIADLLSSAEQFTKGYKRPCKLLDYAGKNGKNIITLNFDYKIEDYLNIDHSKRKSVVGDCFVDSRSVYNYLYDRFCGGPGAATVWHIHGHCNKPGSIRISMENYTNTLSYIKKRFLGSRYCDILKDDWCGRNSCLESFFTKPHVIVGCGLQSEEVLLRGLMIAKYRKMHIGSISDKCCSGIYLAKGGARDSKRQSAKYTFLRALGYDVIEFPSYREIYNNAAWE